MSTSSIVKTTDYQSHFNSEWYLENYFGTMEGEKGVFIKFVLDSYHEFFNLGRIKGGDLVDIGTGPTIHTIVSASRHVERIHLTDYTERNLEILRKWKKGDTEINKDIISYVTSELETDGMSFKNRNVMMQGKVQNISRIDVFTKEVFLDHHRQQYDVITTSNCFESAASTLERYTEVVGNVSAFLKVGGHLVLTGILGTSYYVVDNFEFPCTKLNKDDVQRIYTEAGYNIIKLNTSGRPQQDGDPEDYTDCVGAFTMLAQKIK